MAFILRLPERMKVLVTGGSGIIGQGAVTALLERGHSVRLLSRGAGEDVKAWPAGVEAWPGDIRSPASIEGSADGCEAVVHIVGIVAEDPPESTFARVNVEGTRIALAEATRAGVRRFVYISSLGAERGASDYHRSKAEAEQLVMRFPAEWVIIRPGGVYGPGDENLSVMLRMVRTLPVIPSIGDGSQRLQPIWHEDVAKGIAASVDLPGIQSRVLEVAGPDVVTQRELFERMQALTGRKVPTVPVPEFIASLGVRALKASGIGAPIGETQLEMLGEQNVIADGRPNAIDSILGVTPTPIAEGLRRLLDDQAVQLPEEGVGSLQQKTFAVDVRPSAYDAPRLSTYIRNHLLDLMPALVDANPEKSNPSHIYEGATLTLALPLRGNIQVRAVEVADDKITLMTLAGHPLAGAVRFVTLPIEGGVHFEVQVYDRPASVVDWLMMRPVGDRMQDSTWTQLCESVARVAGATQPEVKKITRDLEGDSAHAVEEWAKNLALQLQRKSHSEAATDNERRSQADTDSSRTSDRSGPPAP